jgi:hypothetical protein
LRLGIALKNVSAAHFTLKPSSTFFNSGKWHIFLFHPLLYFSHSKGSSYMSRVSFDGSIEVELPGGKEVMLSGKLAENIFCVKN